MANLPSLGSKAPDFKANTTSGPIKLSDYIGKWVVLFSHPGDFTPVCTTEFLCFTKYYDEFKKRNTEIIGLSVDSKTIFYSKKVKKPVKSKTVRKTKKVQSHTKAKRKIS